MADSKVSLKWTAMMLWLCIVAVICGLLEMKDSHDEEEHLFITARAFFQEIILSRKWNSTHGGVYVPVTPENLPNPYLKDPNRDVTTIDGLRLTKINPAYMTRQVSELAQTDNRNVQFHITSLKPIRPENTPTDWEEKWLVSFENGMKEQGVIVKQNDFLLFRYMAPLVVTPECMKCHARQGYKVGDIRGGISVSIRSDNHTRAYFFAGYGVVAVMGLVAIFFWGSFYERKKRLFDATFDSPTPTCITSEAQLILMANDSYWHLFGTLPKHQKEMKCYEHRPGDLCNTDQCPLARIMKGEGCDSEESVKRIDGVSRYFIITSKPLTDGNRKVIGVVQSFQEITRQKQIEKALEKSNTELEALSMTDGLTEIANRRHFDDVLAREYNRHARSGMTLSFILLDIDYFKPYNDCYGLLAGDQCLKIIARVISECACRPADLPARYGGEEFACILPETDLSGAVAVAERIRQGILSCAIPHQKSSVHNVVTASLGVVAARCAEGKTASDIILQGDELLYKAKLSGRNRVEALAMEGTEKASMADFVQLVWNDAYCCGNSLIDKQHQSLFRLSNALLNGMLSNGSDTEILKLISQLIDDVKIHFLYEEKILEACRYPELDAHINAHHILLAKSLQLVQKFKASTVSLKDVFHFLAVEVVKQHMVESDCLYYPFVGADLSNGNETR